MKMQNRKVILVMALATLLLAACVAASEESSLPDGGDSAENPVSEEQSEETSGDIGAERETPDLSMLPIGDDFVTLSGPQVGYLWICNQLNGGGAEATGDWYDASTGLWNFYLKPEVDGEVDWDSEISISVEGSTRRIVANGLPSHPTGKFPIAASDDAYQYDRNPNSISAQTYSLDLPANPTLLSNPDCVGGEVGIAINGVAINSAIDAANRDAVATEIQDLCQGHPHMGGVYHYHSGSFCLEDQEAFGHSELIGYILDGFGIYGPFGENGEVLQNVDLDECHGHSHAIDWNGESMDMFHYHATFEFPYTVGCFRGQSVTFSNAQGGDGIVTIGAAAAGEGPPQEAIDACTALAVGDACSVNTPNGTLEGACMPIEEQLACVAQGGPPQ